MTQTSVPSGPSEVAGAHKKQALTRKRSFSFGAQAHKKAPTLLSHRYFWRVCEGSVLVCVCLHVLLFGGNQAFSAQPVCALPMQHAPWTRDVSLMLCGTMIAALCLQVSRICLSTFGSRQENDIGTLSAHYAALCVNLIGTMSLVSTVAAGWGGTCVDVFAAHWPDWLTSIPLLAFIVLSVDDKPSLSGDDLGLLCLLQLAVALGTLAQSSAAEEHAQILLMLSALLLLCPCLWVSYSARKELIKARGNAQLAKRGAQQRKLLLASRKHTLASALTMIVVIFVLIYSMSAYHLISADASYVSFLCFSALAKLAFTSLCMDAHLETSHPAVGLIDAENFSLTSRRAFLRYVFHEVRVPLNSIALGLQILSGNEDLDQTEGETISMMKEAATFMGEVLNDVMALQRVEEGSLELVKRPFLLLELFQTIEDSFIDMANEMDIQFITEIDPALPLRLVGDKFRIGHVLANLVSNAIKFSFVKGSVVLRASAIAPHAKGVTVKFSVQDSGAGISAADQAEDIFQPFRNLKHGELKKDRGSGLGLAICRELVHMHGGSISYTSQLGQGSTFDVVLPLDIASGPVTPQSHWTSRRQRQVYSVYGQHINMLSAQMSSDMNMHIASSSSAMRLSPQGPHSPLGTSEKAAYPPVSLADVAEPGERHVDWASNSNSSSSTRHPQIVSASGIGDDEDENEKDTVQGSAGTSLSRSKSSDYHIGSGMTVEVAEESCQQLPALDDKPLLQRQRHVLLPTASPADSPLTAINSPQVPSPFRFMNALVVDGRRPPPHL